MYVGVEEKLTDTEEWFSSDIIFDRLYPQTMQVLSRRHWTPLQVAREASVFLTTEPGVKILDIGSGVGKFCLAAAHNQPSAFFIGVEQRKNLVDDAETARQTLRLDNVSFVNGNFTQVPFKHFDHFYFYNSFYENLVTENRIDDSIDYSQELYKYYNRYLFKQLEQTRSGTRLVTFHSMEDEAPEGFHLFGSSIGTLLKFWIKE